MQVSSGELRVNNSGKSTRTSKQGDSLGKFVVEELEVCLWGFNVWLEDFMCAVVQWYWECVI
jgi:hypothetical protein